MTVSNADNETIVKSEPGSSSRVFKDFFSSPGAAIGFAVLIIICGLAILAPWISPQNPYDLMQLDIMDGRLAPGSEFHERPCLPFGNR